MGKGTFAGTRGNDEMRRERPFLVGFLFVGFLIVMTPQ
jgi:hypothetical protein